MGIRSSHLHLLAMERAKHPIRGDVLTLGQQAVYGTLGAVKNIFISHGIMPRPLKENFDTKNKIPSWFGTPADKFTNVQSALALLGAEKVSVADISRYENPDYIIDLNYDVAEEYHNRFDVILDIGTFEHIFDVPIALSNFIKMLERKFHTFINSLIIKILIKNKMTPKETKIKYFLYARKSSESEDRQVQSIDDQIDRLKQYAKDKSLDVKEIYT